MNRQKDKTGGNVCTTGGNIPLMVNMAWQLATSCLWPHTAISHRHTAMAKQHIRRLLLYAADPYMAYLEFGERILLTRQGGSGHKTHAMSASPGSWLHPGNKKGYAASVALFRDMPACRKTIAGYRPEFKALPEALLEMAEAPFKNNFNYWAAWFNERQAYGECILFYCCCSKALFNY